MSAAATLAVALNGTTTRTPPGTTLRGLLERAGHGRPGDAPCVVAVNGTHVPAPLLDHTPVRPGDAIEVLTVCQGG